jgi:hypothetical protein
LTVYQGGTAWTSYGRTKYPQLMVNGINQTGGGIAISDDGGFFDWNDGYITYEPLCCNQGLRVRSNLTVEGNVYAYNYYYLSDASLKEVIQPLNYGILDKVLKLNPVSFYWKDENMDKDKHFGFVAQEVEKVLPELVKQDSEGRKTLSYSEFIPYLVQAIKELKAENDALKAEIETLEKP